MGTNLLGEIAGNLGTFIVNGTTEVTKVADVIVVLEETVFASIKVGGVDVKSSYIQDVGTAVKAGAIITPTGDDQFSGVQLTSGSVAIVLG